MKPLDQQLLEEFVAHRDEQAFERLVRSHSPMVMGVCRRYLKPQDASDAFQAVFIILAKKASSMKHHKSVGSWLYRVAVNASLNAQKRISAQAKHEAALEDETHSDPNEEEQRQWALIRPAIDEELCRLPEKDRAPIVLCYLEGLTYDEASKVLGISYKAIEMRLERTRDLLRDRFARRGLVLSSLALATLLAKNASAVATETTIATTAQCACHFGTGTLGIVSNHIAALTKATLKTMFVTNLKIVAVFAIITSGVVTGAGLTALKMMSHQHADQTLPSRTEFSGPSLADEFLKAYSSIERGDRFSEAGDTKQAHAQYTTALNILREIAKRAPDWNPNIIAYRTEYCIQHINGNGEVAKTGTSGREKGFLIEKLSADSVNEDEAGHGVALKSNALITNAEFSLRSETMKISFNDQNMVIHLEADGHVLFSQNGSEIVAERAIFDSTTGVITFSGNRTFCRSQTSRISSRGAGIEYNVYADKMTIHSPTIESIEK